MLPQPPPTAPPRARARIHPVAVVVLATIAVGVAALAWAHDNDGRAAISSQAKTLAGVCPVRTSARWLEVDRTADPACQAAADRALATFGFGRADLVRAAGQPVTAGRWRLTVALPAAGGIRARVEQA